MSLVTEAGYDLVVDRQIAAVTNATKYLEIPAGYLCKKLTLWNQTTTSGYGVYFCPYDDTLSVTGADVEYISSVAVTGSPGQIVTTGKTITTPGFADAGAGVCNVTATGHGFADVTGNKVYISDVVDDGPSGDLETAVNGKVFTITYVDANTFSIVLDISGLTNVWASGGTAQLAADSYNGKYFKIGSSAPYTYHRIYHSTSAGVFYVDGRPASDTDAEIVLLPNQYLAEGTTRDVYYAGVRNYFSFKSIGTGGNATVQAIAHCVRD